MSMRLTPEMRYLRANDLAFRRVVDLLEHQLHCGDLDPVAVRQAATLAIVHFVSRTNRPVYLTAAGTLVDRDGRACFPKEQALEDRTIDFNALDYARECKRLELERLQLSVKELRLRVARLESEGGDAALEAKEEAELAEPVNTAWGEVRPSQEPADG